MFSASHRLIVLTALIAAAAIAAVALAAQPGPGAADRAAVRAWATFAQGQWQTAKLMTSKGSLPRTRRFARATEHLFRRAGRQLQQAAASAGQKIAINDRGLQHWQILRSRLRTLDGATSDRAYLIAAADADVEFRTRMARLTPALTNAALRAYTERWMGLASRHLQATHAMFPRIAHGMAINTPTSGHMPPAAFPPAVPARPPR